MNQLKHKSTNFLWLHFAIFLLLNTLNSQSAIARDVIFGKAKETVSVSFGAETLFRFPLEVKTITEATRFEIKPANAEEPDYSVLVVKPRMTEGSADVTFILSDGTVIRTQLVIANKPNLKRDSIYDFKQREELPDSNPNLQTKRDPMVISELDLMRAMIRRESISGFDVSRVSKSISLGSPHLSAELIKIYQGREMNGYIYQLKSAGKDRFFEVDLKALAIGQPNLAVLAQIDRSVIGGDSTEEREAFLRIVAKPGASSHKIILPVNIRNEATVRGVKSAGESQ